MSTPGRRIPPALPGRQMLCGRCGATIVFARTVASETGRGGKMMPLDLAPDQAGNVAVREAGTGLRARVLGKDEHHDIHAEILAMPHFATCAPAVQSTPPVDELAARRVRKRAAAAKRPTTTTR